MKIIRVTDTETTGLDPARDRIVEIATVDLHVCDPGEEYQAPKRGRMWSSLVNPGIPIPPEASAIHDITDEMVADAPTMGHLIGTGVIAAVEGRPGPPDYACAHNSRFDSMFVDPEVGLPMPWLDTYRIALWVWPGAPNHKNATLRYWLKLKIAIENQPDGRSHRALWDAYITAAILRRAILEGATMEDMLRVSTQPALLPKFTFGKHAMKPIAEIDSGYLDWILKQGDMDEDVKNTAFHELQRRRDGNKTT